MEAKQCDRCGEYYSTNHFTPEYVCVRNVKRTKYTYRKTFDLCKKCSDELAEWINKYCDIAK